MELKRCVECKISKPLSEFSPQRTKRSYGKRVYTTIRSHCKDCRNRERREKYPQFRINWLARCKRYYRAVRKPARQKIRQAKNVIEYIKHIGLPNYKARWDGCDLTVRYLYTLYMRQHCLCYYTGKHMAISIDGKAHDDSMSLDRLDPNKGYMAGNVVWCTNLINSVKRQLTKETFLELVRTVSHHMGLHAPS